MKIMNYVHSGEIFLTTYLPNFDLRNSNILVLSIFRWSLHSDFHVP